MSGFKGGARGDKSVYILVARYRLARFMGLRNANVMMHAQVLAENRDVANLEHVPLGFLGQCQVLSTLAFGGKTLAKKSKKPGRGKSGPIRRFLKYCIYDAIMPRNLVLANIALKKRGDEKFSRWDALYLLGVRVVSLIPKALFLGVSLVLIPVYAALGVLGLIGSLTPLKGTKVINGLLEAGKIAIGLSIKNLNNVLFIDLALSVKLLFGYGKVNEAIEIVGHDKFKIVVPPQQEPVPQPAPGLPGLINPQQPVPVAYLLKSQSQTHDSSAGQDQQVELPSPGRQRRANADVPPPSEGGNSSNKPPSLSS